MERYNNTDIPPLPIQGRAIGILIADGSDGAVIKKVKKGRDTPMGPGKVRANIGIAAWNEVRDGTN
jgi:hypothetical protein